MKLKEIKEKSREIRAEYDGKYHVKWPKEFKKEVLSLLEGGESLSRLSDATGIAKQTIENWRPGFGRQKKNSKFKPVTISGEPEAGIVLRWSESLEVRGLSFPEFCELLNRGLL